MRWPEADRASSGARRRWLHACPASFARTGPGPKWVAHDIERDRTQHQQTNDQSGALVRDPCRGPLLLPVVSPLGDQPSATKRRASSMHARPGKSAGPRTDRPAMDNTALRRSALRSNDTGFCAGSANPVSDNPSSYAPVMSDNMSAPMMRVCRSTVPNRHQTSNRACSPIRGRNARRITRDRGLGRKRDPSRRNHDHEQHRRDQPAGRSPVSHHAPQQRSPCWQTTSLGRMRAQHFF